MPDVVRPWRELNWPNRISLGRLLLVAPLVVLIININDPDWPWARYAALGVFFLMAISDFVDGQLARRLNLRTRLGAILDPIADKVLIICAVIILSLAESSVPGVRLASWVVVAVVGKDLWVVLGFAVVYLVTGKFLVRPSLAGKASTTAQLAMVLTVLLAPDLNAVAPGLGFRAALVMELIVAGLAVVAVLSYTRIGLSFVMTAGQQPIDRPR
jgi:cardiolipin synthase